MTLPEDYSQPEFFRFSTDSLFLAREVGARFRTSAESVHLVELGAGSGVVSCEISQMCPIARATLVEAQREWEAHLGANLSRFGRIPAWDIAWERVSEFNRDGKIQAQLIVSNPPYFDPARGRPSRDPRRNVAHRLILDDWAAWLACMGRTLAPGGEAWYLQKDPGPVRGELPLPEGFGLKHEVRSGPMRLLCLRHLQVE